MSDILLIHRDIPTFDNIKRILNERDFGCITARNCREGLRALENNYQIDLILVDGSLEFGKQLELLNSIHKTPKFYFIPVIVICNNCDTDMIKKLINFGVFDIMSSAVTIEEKVLLDRVENALKHSKPKILFVEENDLLVGHLIYISNLSGFRGEGVSNIESAFEKIENDVISVLAMDIKFTLKHGLDIIADIKGKFEGMPVIMLATHDIRPLKRDVLADGADGYLTRPFNNLEFFNLVRYLLMDNKTKKQPAYTRLAR
ncbi:MAG: response regulator transcription factor [FCB group bacterium]|nr:response regulator transcription factor [FCB group bacterium]